MENKYYQNYIDGNIDLASSIVIKCEDAAKSLNQWVLAYTNVEFDEFNLRTWKYYKNICGEYFDSDKEMVVTSVDSLTEIVFSKQNLEYHRATKKAYAFGTTYYKELVDRYPDQEQLIRGILYPVDMEFALSAYDGQILTYPASLVEATEPSMIPQLQDWINGFLRRWHNVQYQNTDNLYLTSMLGVMYAMLPGAIENIRLNACHTHEVHSYHVQQYLASHSKLDRYLPYMTRKQAMFFYHNLPFIESNNGREEIFNLLLRRVFTDRNLPMGHFSLLHSTEHMPEESLVPLVVFEKTPLNTEKNIDNKDQYSLNDILDIQDEINPANRAYRDDEQAKIVKASTFTLNPNVPTKLLQSTVIDYTDSEKYRMADVVLQHWLWLAHKGLYQAFISFVVPATGIRLSLSAADAFTFYAYAFCKGMGLTLDKLPMVVCSRVERLPTGTVASMREVCEKRYVSDEWLATTRALMPAVPPMISLESFGAHCTEVFEAANEQYALTAVEEKMTARGQKEAAICRLWGDEQFQLGDYPGQYYADWFAARNLVVKDLTESQLLEVSNVILKEATGANLASTITLKDIQRAMANMFLDLSSYSIQIGLNINTGPVLHAGFPSIRPDNPDISSKKFLYYPIPTVDPRNIKTYGFMSKFWNLNDFPTMRVNRHDTAHAIKFNHAYAYFNMSSKDDLGNDFAVIKIGRRYGIGNAFKPIVNLQAPNPRNLTIVPGMEKFLELPLQTQIDSYVDTWAK